MDAFFVNTGGDGTPGPMSGEVVKDGYNNNFDIIAREFTNRRTITGNNALTQDDDNAFIKLNSATSFDITLDQLAAGTKISFYNVGAGAVTFTNGSGVTVLGSTTLPGASGTSYPTAIVTYESLTSPRVINAGTVSGGGGTGDVVGPASATNNVPALFDGTTGKLIKDSTPTGTGNPVMDTSPTLITPNLGTPSALVLTNATGLPLGGIVDSSAASKLLGRGSAGGAGDFQEITLGTNLSMSGTTLNAAGGGGGGGTGDVVGPSSVTDSVPVLFDGTTGKLIKANTFAALSDFVTGTDNVKQVTVAGILSFRKLKRQSCSISGGTMTLDLASAQEAKFENTTTVTADFTLAAFSNATNAEVVMLIIYVTGSIYITMPSTFVMETIDDRWNNTLKKLYISSGTANPVTISFNKMNALWEVRAGFAQYAS